MTYLLVSHTSNLNGAERSLLELAYGLKNNHKDILVLCPNHGLLVEKLRQLDIPVFIKQLPDFDLRPRYLFIFLFFWIPNILWFCYFLKTKQIKCVYNNTIVNLYTPWATFLTRTPCLWHIREIRKERRGRLLFVFLFKYLVDMVVFNSTDTMLGYYSKPCKHWFVVYNGVAVSSHLPTRQPKELITLGYIGQLIPHKRPELFIQIVKAIHQKRPHIQAIIAGDGASRLSLEHLVQVMELQNVVTFLGYVMDTKEVYNQIDIFILTSAQEPFGRVLIEAMANGIPVVASNVGGVSEVVQHNVTGYLVPDNDLDAFVQAVTTLIENPTLGDKMGLAGYHYVQNNFSLSQYQQKLIIYLEQLASSKM